MKMDKKTIFRIQKIQSLQELSNKTFHCYDFTNSEIKNFDKDLKKTFNKPIWTLLGKFGDAYQDIKRLKSKYNVEERKNSCKSMECIFSLTKEHFIDINAGEISKEKVKQFTNRTLKFVKEEFGENQIAHAVLHLHETTPHIHVFIVPWEVTNKRGRYECEPYNLLKTKKYSPDYLSKLQDKYFQKFKDLGFKPVVKKRDSGISNKQLKEYYQENIENQKVNNENIKKLEVENELVNKELDLTKKALNKTKLELEETKKELSKLKQVFEYVKAFFNVDKIKDVLSKVRNVQEKEGAVLDSIDSDIAISYDDTAIDDYFNTQQSKLTPKPQPTQKKISKYKPAFRG